MEKQHTIEEQWYPIIGFREKYEVSNYLRVRRLKGKHCKKTRLLKVCYRTFRDPKRVVGYPYVCLSYNGYRTCSDVRKLKRDAIKYFLNKK